MRRVRPILFVAAWLASGITGQVWAQGQSVDYAKQVKPLLKERCYACHGGLKQEGGLRLDTAKLIRDGGDSGKVVSIGAAVASSLLLERVSEADPTLRMPPEHEGEPLKPAEIELLRKWIEGGAQGPADEVPDADPKDHWSFRPVARPVEPAVTNTGWVRNPIDSWIAAGHQQHGLTPQPEASRIVLLRRLSMDLIGLPPTAAEVAAFESDTSADWYEKAVERLLKDPRHGERWARHWMDIWRYSDWWGLGDQIRNSQPHMWHFRDWIVESLNEDMPYDEMVRLMLAADELAPNDPDQLRATGFLARNYYIFNRTSWMDDVVTHVSKGLLGLTMNCAKCHDHKFDPIQHADFFKMRAFFEPYQVRLDMVPGESNIARNAIPRVFDGNLNAPTYLFVRGDDANPDTSKVIAPGIPDILAFEELTIEPVTLPQTAWQPGRQQLVLENHLAAARQRLQTALAKRDEAARALGSASSAGGGESNTFAPIVETFETLDAARWKVDGDGWTHRPGKMEQRQDGPVTSTLTLTGEVPRDFEAVLRYELLGGSTWRSVGLEFDVTPTTSGDQANSTGQVVYLSGASGGSKIQGAFSKKGGREYPAAGMKPFAVEVGKEYTLNLRVRGDLVNAAVNGEHVLSWRTPVARQPGSLRVMTFDALAILDEFRLAPLDPAAVLLEPTAAPSASPNENLELAEAALAVAQAEMRSIELRAAAIQAQQKNAAPAAPQEPKIAAIRAERQVAVEQARREVIVAQQALNHAAAEKQDEARKKLAAAQAALHQADAALVADIQPQDQFTVPEGAKWSATRFLHTGSDDPTVEFPATSTGRRSALAKWITDRRNPLTARVAVNHLWSRHFGAPLAPTPFDFGRNSPAPSHPEVIDWLATELMDHQWSMKHLHRLIVTSATYRMSSSLAGAEKNIAQDPDNRYLWRRLPIRVESQAVRDSILSLAGLLDPAMGGPSIPVSQQQDSKRRSLYFFHSNNERNLFLMTFDEADVGECYRREQSIVPQQALALANSGLVLDAARQIADREATSTTDDADFVRRLFTVVLGIHPGEAEVAASLEAMKRWKAIPNGSAESARANLVWILLNHNDFVTLR